MSARRTLPWDAVLYAASAVVTLIFASIDDIPFQQRWAELAAWPYAAGASLVMFFFLSRRRRRSQESLGLRIVIAAAVFLGVVVVPLATEVTLRARGEPGHAQSDVIVVEEAASVLLDGENPYAASYRETPLGVWPPAAWNHLAYLPDVVLFGLPHAGLGGALTDSRVMLLLVTLAVAAAALRSSRASPDQRLFVLLFLIVLPTGARYAVGSGHDLVVLALMMLSLVTLDRGRPAVSGAILGAAAAIKQTAWPLLPFLLAASLRRGRASAARTLGAIAAVVVPLVVPFAIWNPDAFVDDTVLYPLGLAAEPTLAGEEMPGALLANALPFTRPLLLGALVIVPAAVALFLLFHRSPKGAAAAAQQAALVTFLLLVLAPAGRPGYLIYPLELLLWSRLLLTPAVEPRQVAGAIGSAS